jgi:hypothetical protein
MMNRTFERLTFFTLGGIFVVLGYLLSGVNTGAAPQENITEFDTIRCEKLIVHDGMPGTGKIILGFGEDGASEIYLSSTSEDVRDAAIYLSVSETSTFLEMWGLVRESGLISLQCSDTGAILQASTLDREEVLENHIEDDIKEDRSGIVIEATPERALLSIEERPVVSAERVP